MLTGKVAVVTGSSRGIGAAIALAMAEAGAAVVVNYFKNRDVAEQVCLRITEAGGKAVAIQGDVTRIADMQKLVALAVEQFGRLDIMVNNAGVESRTSLLESSEQEFDKVMAVSLKGAFFSAQCAAKQMIAQGEGGRIINISSVHEVWPMPGNTPYCCAKGGVAMLTRNAGVELAPHGIGVVGIAPGAIATAMNEQTLENAATYKTLKAAIPQGRVGTPEEVADLAVYLASDKARYITATTVFIDGGMTQQSPGL